MNEQEEKLKDSASDSHINSKSNTIIVDNPELEEWGDEKLAKLVEFDDSPDIPQETFSDNTLPEKATQSNDGNKVSQSELFDEPIEERKSPRFSSRPIPKAAAVGSVLLVVFGGGGLFLQSVVSDGKRKAHTVANSPSPQPTPSISSSPDTEVGNLKTQLALGNQENQIKDLERSKTPKTPNTKATKTEPTKTANSTASKTVASATQKTPPTYPARPERERYTPSSPRPLASPHPERERYTPSWSRTVEPPRPTTPTSTSAPTLPSKQQAVDPMQQWMALSQLGSFGTNSVGGSESSMRGNGTAIVSNSTQPQTGAKVVTMPRAVPVVSSTGGVPFNSTAQMAIAPAQVAQNIQDTSVSENSGSLGRIQQLRDGREASEDTGTRRHGDTGEEDTETRGHGDAENFSTESTGITASLATKAPASRVIKAASTNLSQPLSVPIRNTEQISEISIEQASPVVAQINPTEETSILNGVPVRFLQVGTQARAQLVTPLVWAKTDSTEGEKFVVQLSEPMANLPQGTTIVFQVAAVSESGLVQLKATSLVVNGQEYVLPPEAISVRGQSGQPLIADKWGDKGPAIASGDVTAFLFGSLSKVGEVLNQPDVQQSINSSSDSFSSSTTTKNRRPNLLGAILEGGFGPLTDQILQRNDQAIQEIISRPNVWYVRAGESVQVFVNQSFEL